jgi:hypothetical protein
LTASNILRELILLAGASNVHFNSSLNNNGYPKEASTRAYIKQMLEKKGGSAVINVISNVSKFVLVALDTVQVYLFPKFSYSALPTTQRPSRKHS